MATTGWIFFLGLIFSTRVTGNPSFKSMPTTVKTFVNKTVVLPCQVDNLGEPTRIRWWREGILLTDSGDTSVKTPRRVTMENRNLKVSHVQPDDSGEYVCKASRPASWGDVTQVYAIEVMYSPSVHTVPESGELEVNLGEVVDMACVAKGVPIPTISWRAKGKELQLLDDRSRLQFRADNLDLAGAYFCMANNSIGEPATATIDLKIRYKPKVRVAKGWVHAAPDFRVQLECRIKAWPEAEVEWYLDGQRIAYSSRVVRHTSDASHSLIIKKARESDYGNYTVFASNALGTDKGFIQLSGAPKPVVVKSESRAISPTTYNFIWEVDSYIPILYYVFMFRENQNGVRGEWHNIHVPSSSDDTGPVHVETFNLTGLNEATSYEAIIRCQNRYGLSEPMKLIRFSTAHTDARPGINERNQENIPEVHLSSMSQQTSSEKGINGADCAQRTLCLILLGTLSIFLT